MPESVHSTTTTQIPRIPEPVVLTWTPDYDDGDVAYIAGSPPPPIPPPPSLASSSSTSVDTVRGHPLPPLPPPPPPSLVSERSSLGQFWASAVSLAHATIGEGSNSRRVSLVDEETALDAIMEETPAEHIEARVPAHALEYAFSPIEGEGESMLVVPPLDAPDARPVYHIKVTHDLFDPSFFVTTVRRGGNDGDVVGDFMMKAGCSALEETVFFKKLECHIFKKLVAITKKVEFQWRLHDSNDGSLLWKWDRQWTCRHVPERNIIKNKNYELLAQFHPPSAMRTPSNTAKVARMTVYPPGQKFFDEIIMSVLVLERKRRTLMGTRRMG